MAYQIEYAYTCHIGKVRNNNEDNFWCCGESLDSENKGMSHVCSGHIKQADLPLLAVFDGMGGESCGEMAAFLAAESCGQYYKEKKKESLYLWINDEKTLINGKRYQSFSSTTGLMDLDSYTKYEMDTEMVLMQEYDGVDPYTGEYSGRWRAVSEDLRVRITVSDAL